MSSWPRRSTYIGRPSWMVGGKVSLSINMVKGERGVVHLVHFMVILRIILVYFFLLFKVKVSATSQEIRGHGK